MRRFKRSLSELIAVLGLLGITLVAVAIGYTIITNYTSRSLNPSYDVSVTYGKLVLITTDEVVGGIDYATFRGEIGVSNPSGQPRSMTICIVSAKPSASGYTTYKFTSYFSCATITADTGYNVYSFLIRISYPDLNAVGCSTNLEINIQNCPLSNEWRFTIDDANGRTVAIVKPTYIIP
jgi:hypothetical protein